MRRLQTLCEGAKRNLSSNQSTTIIYDNFYDGIDMNIKLSRSKFEMICSKEFERCLKPVNIALNDAKLSYNDIDDIVLVGGSIRVPKIQEVLNGIFPNKLRFSINPDEAVACGASIQAAILNKQKDSVLDQLVLVDVLPLSLGLETSGGLMEIMIKKNTTIPTGDVKQMFSTYSDNQPDVNIKVYEGERKFTENNNLLGTFILTNIPAMPRGTPKIKVKFNIDANGILQVSATEESTKVTKKITIENDRNRFTAEQIKGMIESSEKMANGDKIRRDKLEARNDIENYIYNIRNTIDNPEFMNRMGEDKYKLLSDIIIKGKQWLENNINIDKHDYKMKQKSLEEKIKPLMTSIYEKN
jgi:L1 cell adhesion molecule like protein